MQQYHLEFRATNTPELLERIFRVVRHRGFSVLSSQALLNESQQEFHVKLCVSGSRALEYLTKQLEKLWDVQSLEVK